MSKKYAIELDDRIKLVTSVGVTENGVVYTTSDYVHNLEELNSDYINEHYGELQDEAYQKGFEDGKNSIDNGCEGCKYEDQHGYDEPCNKCLHAHANHYTPMPKDEICFGDEIVVNGERGVVVSHENEGCDTIWAMLNGYRTPQIVHKNNYTKTGRRFDMAGIMEAVKNG